MRDQIGKLFASHPRYSGLRRRMSRVGAFARRVINGRTPRDGSAVPDAAPVEIQPWTPSGLSDADTRAAFESRIATANLRLMPYPFTNALSIVTDLDAAERIDYVAYRSQLVDELGLDFGDSAFLHCTGGMYPRNVRAVREMALSFFRYDGNVYDLSSRTRNLNSIFTFLEVLREYHLGNISHLHSYGVLGPRLVPLGVARKITEESADFSCPQEATNVIGFAVRQVVCLAIAIHLTPALARRLREVEIFGNEGAVIARYRAMPLSTGTWQPKIGSPRGALKTYWFEFESAPNDDPAPMYSQACEVRLRFDRGAAERGSVGDAVIVGVHRETIWQMLDTLDRVFNVRFNLLVDHNASSFIAPSTEKYRRSMNLDAHDAGGAASHYGRVREKRLSFSTLSDDPEATAYVGDFIHDRLGIVYINPGGWSGELVPLDLSNLVLPVETRDGQRVYLARRVIPQLQNDDHDVEGLKSDMGTRSFCSRLATALDEAATATGRVWPIYTHLGNVRPKDQRGEPYLDWAPLRQAQAMYYGFKFSGPNTPRLWVTQPTTLYHYAAMMRDAPDYISQGEDEHCWQVTPWDDSITGQRFGETPDSLHGITIYVPDRNQARLFLGEKEIDDFTRNPPDSTGRASVTVVGTAVKHVLFDAIEPRIVVESAIATSSAWLEAEDAYSRLGYLSLNLDEDGSASFSIPLPACHFAAAQYLSYALRINDGIDGAIVGLVTTDSGAFCFEHGCEVPSEGTATYKCADSPTGEWRRHIVPFYDLDWSTETAHEVPLPNRRLQALTIRISGCAGGRLDLDCLSLIRPRGWRHPASKEGFVFGGEVRTAEGLPAIGATVRLQARPLEEAKASAVHETVTDEVGLFAFTSLPAPAILEVSVRDKEGAQDCSEFFELHGDSFCAVLTAGQT